MPEPSTHPMVPLDVSSPIWAQFFTVAPLVIVGTREPDGSPDLAPKHMAMPLGWQNHYGFVCSPRHATQRNAQATGAFTVSFPTPAQLLAASFAAGRREQDGTKPSLAALPLTDARVVDGVLVEGASAWLECELDRVIDGFGENTLITGRIVAAAISEEARRDMDSDDGDVIAASPLLAYLSPGRFASVADSLSFPYPAGFSL